MRNGCASSPGKLLIGRAGLPQHFHVQLTDQPAFFQHGNEVRGDNHPHFGVNPSCQRFRTENLPRKRTKNRLKVGLYLFFLQSLVKVIDKIGFRNVRHDHTLFHIYSEYAVFPVPADLSLLC